MWISTIVIAEAGLTWTPETFYVAAAVVHLVLILLLFRLLQLPADQNTFINALFVAVPTNGVAFLTKDLGIISVLLTGIILFGLLAAISRGDVLKSGLVWLAAVGAYWVLAYFIVPHMAQNYFHDPRQADLDYIAAELGGLPQVLLQGGLEAEPLTADDYERLRRGGGEE